MYSGMCTRPLVETEARPRPRPSELETETGPKRTNSEARPSRGRLKMQDWKMKDKK